VVNQSDLTIRPLALFGQLRPTPRFGEEVRVVSLTIRRRLRQPLQLSGEESQPSGVAMDEQFLSIWLQFEG